MSRFALPHRLAAALIALAASVAAQPAAAPPPPRLYGTPIALLTDLGTGQELFAQDAGTTFLPASMAKAMSTLIAFDMIAEGRLREDQWITVRPETAARWSGRGTTLALRPGQTIQVRDLLMGMTTVSANDAAVALAEGAAGSVERWAALMNAEAARLGMTGSHFETPNGFPDHRHTVITARDMVPLARALVERHPALYRAYIGHPAFVWNGATLASHDPFAGTMPGADGIKTGHSYEAGFNFLGTTLRQGRRLVVVIGGAPTEPGRAAAAKALIEWGYAGWPLRHLAPPGWVAGQALVQGGTARHVDLVAPDGVDFAAPAGSTAPVRARIVYTGPLVAPIARGTVVARLELSAPGLPPGSIPLRAGEAIAKGGVIDRLRDGVLAPLP